MKEIRRGDEDHNEDVNVSCDNCVWAFSEEHDLVAHTGSPHRDTNKAKEDDIEYTLENEIDLNRMNEEDINKFVEACEKRYCK